MHPNTVQFVLPRLVTYPWPATEGKSPGGDGPATVFLYDLSDAAASSTDCEDGRFGQMFTYVRPNHGPTN